jgi:hypothetical protein
MLQEENGPIVCVLQQPALPTGEIATLLDSLSPCYSWQRRCSAVLSLSRPFDNDPAAQQQWFTLSCFCSISYCSFLASAGGADPHQHNPQEQETGGGDRGAVEDVLIMVAAEDDWSCCQPKVANNACVIQCYRVLFQNKLPMKMVTIL